MAMNLFPSFQKTLRLHLKDHSVNAVRGNNRVCSANHMKLINGIHKTFETLTCLNRS